ncbi:MAG: SUMF1/EgtB/PvdO family nonheme iron enzyme, partial [Treponema sp.]|nr:SUMF1/EgtB/PvdO family nonheme iron enzyme [Treponema sp.]
MKRFTVFFLLSVCLAAGLCAQAKPRLAILPFTGGNAEDAETIAEFFSYEDEINRVFVPVPRTRAVETLMKEQEFQRSGLTDSDTIAELGKQLNADYVLAGHIAALGNSKLLLITIVNVKELQQIAGDYREYQRIESVVDVMPDMAKRIAEASRRDASRLPRLAVLPFNVLSSGMNQQDAELLAQLLATEIANSGRYAVFPRTKAIEKVMEEHHIERSGMTDAESIKAIGEAVNAQYVLSANVRMLGADNYFSASILHIVEASQGRGTREKYQNVNDGLKIMPKMAQTLSGGALPQTGSILVSSGAAGMIVVNGRDTGVTVTEGGAATVSNVNPGSAALGVRGANGQVVQGPTVAVSAGQTANARIERPAPPVPAGFVLAPGGTFTMGSNNGDNDEKPVHTVTVRGFYIGRTEVTQKEWTEVMGSNPSYFKGDTLPVENVSWNDAVEYCNRRSVREGLTPAYRGSGNSITCDFRASGYRLPTEAEWEYAAKGGNKDYMVYEY